MSLFLSFFGWGEGSFITPHTSCIKLVDLGGSGGGGDGGGDGGGGDDGGMEALGSGRFGGCRAVWFARSGADDVLTGGIARSGTKELGEVRRAFPARC